LVLSDLDFPVMTGELIYPGIARTRRNVEIWAGKEVLVEATSREILHQSGLSLTSRNCNGDNVI
jgi:hypothetical protein